MSGYHGEGREGGGKQRLRGSISRPVHCIGRPFPQPRRLCALCALGRTVVGKLPAFAVTAMHYTVIRTCGESGNQQSRRTQIRQQQQRK